MTDTDTKPTYSDGVTEAAHQVAGELDTGYLNRQHKAVAAIIQRAVDEAVAPVEAERNDLEWYAVEYLRERDEARAALAEMTEIAKAAKKAAGELWVALAKGRMKLPRDVDNLLQRHAAYAPDSGEG